MKQNSVYFTFILFCMALDQAVKEIIARNVPLYSSHPVIPGFFNITRIHNRGAIFGAFNQTGNHLVFAALTGTSLLALGLVAYYFFKTPASERLMKISLSLIIAGALGNFVDRIARGYVIDFLDFYIRDEHFPFFNVADSCITIGAFLMLIIFLRRKPACSQSS